MITEEERKRLNARLNAKGLARSNKQILAEYRRLGIEPVYAGDDLVSPALAKMLNPASALCGND